MSRSLDLDDAIADIDGANVLIDKGRIVAGADLALRHYSGPAEVDTIIVAGRVVKRGGKLLGVDLRGPQNKAGRPTGDCWGEMTSCKRLRLTN